MKLGTIIKKYREARKLTQPNLSQLINVTPTYLSAVENNRKEPSIKLISDISRVLNVPKEMLFWEAITINDKMNDKDKKIVNAAKNIVNNFYFEISRSNE